MVEELLLLVVPLIPFPGLIDVTRQDVVAVDYDSDRNPNQDFGLNAA
jgi:hypothetical protein